MKVKICGMKDTAAALKAVEYGADALGFVFADSKRKITKEAAREIIDNLPSHVMKVGVFVNEKKERIEEIAAFCGLTHIQLHGEESQEFIDELRYPAIKALNINGRRDLLKIGEYRTEYILLDSPKGTYRGGSGLSFDWEFLKDFELNGQKVILAGGLRPENVAEAIMTVKPYMVDVSSGVETDGQKDLGKIEAFIKAAKKVGGVTV
ncbi:N-(5'-phosphoribosyl)anthranilate isomerase [Bacillus sp. FJAT-27225]|uniref:phosphoribosylanthranilate isomerase n=1 Tax=Bacillus sp. FJAT-27225 TaxID=1743144 RepID=UPI00080C259F|nr:phosphoribosylanthranilate isomerase [Bacillus sp. FJAT-27225]OCA90797.1 N-(5'-phosphoribosyl)anthranilate isomerase [Bacillus sp. FJAT-27225]